MRGLREVVEMVVFSRRTARAHAGHPQGRMPAVDRFARAVHRFSDRVEVIPDRRLRRELQQQGELLIAALRDVRMAARIRPRPADAETAIRAILRAGTACAQATEAALLAANANRLRDQPQVDEHLTTVRETVLTIQDLADTYVAAMR
jgi:hypothetical protein